MLAFASLFAADCNDFEEAVECHQEPNAGIEPATFRLRNERSTN